VMNADGSGEINLTNGLLLSQALSWSPGGKQILFQSVTGKLFQVYVVNADGTQRHQLTNTPESNLVGEWSPDGKRIVFGSNRDGNGEIYVMNADGSGQINLTKNPARDDWPDVWSPDGQWIAFASNRNKPECGICLAIYVMKADGSMPRQLTDQFDAIWEPAWQP